MLNYFDIVTPLQVISLFLFLFDIVLWFIVYKDKRYSNIKPIMFLILSYILNITTFYVSLIIIDIYEFDKISPTLADVMMGWSTGIRVHLGLILAISFTAAIFWKRICLWIQSH